MVKNALTGWSGYEPHPDSPVNGVYDQIFQNVAIGTEALENTGSNEMTDNISDNTSVGYRSMRGGGSGINGASFNSAFGASSLIAINSGDNNTAIGSSAGFYITTGNNNTVVGKNSGLTLVTGNDNTLIGEDANVSVSGAVSQIAIGHNVNCTGNSTVTIGADANTASLGLDGSDTSWAAASSDERLKENIETSTAGLALIKDLRPVNYNWKKAKDVPVDMPQYVEGSDEPAFGYEYGKTLHGFIAQVQGGYR